MRLRIGNAVALLSAIVFFVLGASTVLAQDYDFNESMINGDESYSSMDEDFYESSSYNRDGRFYVGGGIGMSFLDIDNDADKLFEVSDDEDMAKEIFLGYSFNDYVSLEAYYADLGTAELERLPAEPNYNNLTDGELDYTTYGLSGVFSLPIFDALSVFLKLGYSQYEAEGSDLGKFVEEDNSGGIHVGVGAEYALTDNLAVRLGYTSVDKDDAQYWATNVVYYFGHEEPEEEIEIIEPVVTPEKRLIELAKNVYFITDKAELTTSAKQALDEVASILNTHSYLNITIGAHTDSRASDAYNLNLSDRRAKSVASYLISRNVSPSRMAARGFGESRPIASNETAEGRAKNRRVEIRTVN